MRPANFGQRDRQRGSDANHPKQPLRSCQMRSGTYLQGGQFAQFRGAQAKPVFHGGGSQRRTSRKTAQVERQAVAQDFCPTFTGGWSVAYGKIAGTRCGTDQRVDVGDRADIVNQRGKWGAVGGLITGVHVNPASIFSELAQPLPAVESTRHTGEALRYI